MMNIIIENDTNHDKNEKHFLRLFNKALVFQSNNQVEEAIDHYLKALDYNPNHLPVLQVVAMLYQKNKQFEEAIVYYKKALARHKNSATLNHAIANCLESTQQLRQAKNHYECAINLRQDYSDALNNHGNLCRKLGLYDEAEYSLLRALRQKISVETLANLGLLMSETRQFSLANSFYEHALRLQPDNAKILWNKGLLYLTQGKLEEGWKLYQYGLSAGTRPLQKTPKNIAPSQANLNYFKGKSVFIRREQGLGDEIMFASCFNEIIDVAESCFIEADDRLVPIFQRTFEKAKIIPRSDRLFTQTTPIPSFDIDISVASLPMFLRKNFDDFNHQSSYLTPYKRATNLWKSRYRKKGDGLNIGISWRGGVADEAAKRSAALIDWATVLKNSNCQFVNLQYGTREEEISAFQHYLHEWDDTDHFYNIEQLAAQIAALDLVITVSNVTAHLAGALGKPVWIILPYSPNWRWFDARNPSPWYPSAKIFRQSEPGNWNSVFEKVNQALSNLIDQHLNSAENNVPIEK